MKVFTELEQLQSFLPLNSESDSSFALVFVQDSLDAFDIAAIREAVRVCDVAVVASIGDVIRDKAAQEYLKTTNIQALYLSPLKVEANRAGVTLATTGFNGTVLLQILLALMPSLVVVPEKRRSLNLALEDISSTFPNFFLKKTV